MITQSRQLKKKKKKNVHDLTLHLWVDVKLRSVHILESNMGPVALPREQKSWSSTSLMGNRSHGLLPLPGEQKSWSSSRLPFAGEQKWTSHGHVPLPPWGAEVMVLYLSLGNRSHGPLPLPGEQKSWSCTSPWETEVMVIYLPGEQKSWSSTSP